MTNLQLVQLAMNSVGALADLLVVDEYEDERLWHIAVDETTEMFAELADSRDVLVLSIELGKAADPAAIYELALRYAHAWENADGARLTLDAPDGSMWIISEIGASSLTPEKLASAIKASTERAKGWREIVSGAASPISATSNFALEPSFIQA